MLMIDKSESNKIKRIRKPYVRDLAQVSGELPKGDKPLIEHNLNAIDACKFFMAICVVAIHTQPLFDCFSNFALRLYNCLVPLAVPFFFLSNGFLMVRRLDLPYGKGDLLKVARRKMMQFIKMYVFWNIVYLPLAIWHYYISEDSFTRALALYFREFFLIGEHYNSWMLWYLLSGIYTLAFMIICLNCKMTLTSIVLLGTVLICIGTWLTYLSNHSGSLPIALSALKYGVKLTIANGRIFTGFFYIPCGVLLSSKKLPLAVNWILFIGGFAANYCVGSTNVFCVAICVVGLFGILEEVELRKSRIYPTMRKMSTGIYFIHLWVWTVLYSVIYGEKTYGLLPFIGTAGLSLTLTYIYIRATRQIKNN